MASTPRGLLNFIRDIRNCANKEDEKKRVNVELANIRTKFKSDKLSPYERKKCAPSAGRAAVGATETLRVPFRCPGMCGSCCTSTCLATTSSLDTWRLSA